MEQLVLWIGVIAAVLTAAYNFLQNRDLQAEIEALQNVPATEGPAVPGVEEVK